MQKLATRLSAALFLLLIVATQNAAAADWVEVTEDVEGWAYFLDRESILPGDGTEVYAWVRTVYPDKSYRLTLYQFDFSRRTRQTLAIHRYDANGRQTDSNTKPSEKEYIIPDSIAEGVYLYIKDLLGW